MACSVGGPPATGSEQPATLGRLGEKDMHATRNAKRGDKKHAKPCTLHIKIDNLTVVQMVCNTAIIATALSGAKTGCKSYGERVSDGGEGG